MANIFTDQNFDVEVLKSDKLTFVDFWAPWCGPCQQMSPMVEELVVEYGDKIKVGKVNVDDNSSLAGQYSVMSIPTFILFKGGQVVDTTIGGMPKEKLKAFIDKHLKA